MESLGSTDSLDLLFCLDEYSIGKRLFHFLTNQDILKTGVTCRSLFNICKNQLKLFLNTPTANEHWFRCYRFGFAKHGGDQNKDCYYSPLRVITFEKVGLTLSIYSNSDKVVCVISSRLSTEQNIRHVVFLDIPEDRYNNFAFYRYRTHNLNFFNLPNFIGHIEFFEPNSSLIPGKFILFDFTKIDDLKICVYNLTNSHSDSSHDHFLLNLYQDIKFNNLRPSNYESSLFVDILIKPLSLFKNINKNSIPLKTYFSNHLYFWNKTNKTNGYQIVKLDIDSLTDSIVGEVFSSTKLTTNNLFLVGNNLLVCWVEDNIGLHRVNFKTDVSTFRVFENKIDHICVLTKRYILYYTLYSTLSVFVILDTNVFDSKRFTYDIHKTVHIRSAFFNNEIFYNDDESFFLRLNHEGLEQLVFIEINKFDHFLTTYSK